MDTPSRISCVHCYQSFSRGTLLVLLMSGLVYAVHWLVYSSIALSLPENFRFLLDCAHPAFYVLLPVTGWVAESWLGRYRAIVTGLLFTTVAVLFSHASFLMLQSQWSFSSYIAFTLAGISLVVGTLGIGTSYTIMLPFTLDQMIGASAEELSAAVQWYYWVFNIPLIIKEAFHCIPIPKQFPEMLPMAYLTIGSLSLSAVLILDCLCHKWLDTYNKTGKPVKMIFQVLNYARKNKCPRLRSALTYIDEEHPSRIDFGKHKFGGPFTEEEVEDVKTVFRLAPLLVAAIGATLNLTSFDQLNIHTIPSSKQTFECVHNLKITMYYATSFILIPIYRFILHPLVGKYAPSMLKSMVTGLFLCFVVSIIELNVLSIGHFYSNASHCIFNDLTAIGTIPIPLYWILIIHFVNGVGVVLVMCSLFEFVVAQAPNRMRGIMMGLMITANGIGNLGDRAFPKIFKVFQTASPSCVFYYYLVLSLLLLLILIVFVILAKRYKLREREKHINIQAIVEEHYERYLDQEEQYMREAGASYRCRN